ncbi:MAG: flagellar biosynthetic protein FliO [Pseudomonadota bacterium]
MKTLIRTTWLLAATLGSAAAAESTAVRTTDPLSAEQLWRTGGSLVLLIVLIVAAIWFLRRAGAGPRGAGRQIAFVDALALGQRERLVLVQVGGEQILLGVSPGRVERVHVLENPVVFDPVEDTHFSTVLKRAVSSGALPQKGASDAA